MSLHRADAVHADIVIISQILIYASNFISIRNSLVDTLVLSKGNSLIGRRKKRIIEHNAAQ